MKRIIASLLLAAAANATVLLDRGTNIFYVTNNVTTGSTALTNNVTNVIASGAFVAGSNAFGAASFAPQVFYTGVTNVVLTGGLTGSLTNGVLTVDGSTAALGVAAPTSGTYVAQSKDGVITWEPVSAMISTSYNSTIWSTQWGVTNFFYAAGRTTQTWTWGGGTTQIMIKAWGAGGSISGSVGGVGGFVAGVIKVTNNQQLLIMVGNAGIGGSGQSTQFTSVISSSWPGGGTYNTSAVTFSASGGGYTCVLSETNIVLLAGGAGNLQGSGTAGNGGWPNGGNGIATGGGGAGGGTQTTGGSGAVNGQSGSYLQGGNCITGNIQVCGGGGYYGGGSSAGGINIASGGGSSYLNTSILLYGYGTLGSNSGDINYSSTYSAMGKDGLVLIITPTP